MERRPRGIRIGRRRPNPTDGTLTASQYRRLAEEIAQQRADLARQQNELRDQLRQLERQAEVQETAESSIEPLDGDNFVAASMAAVVNGDVPEGRRLDVYCQPEEQHASRSNPKTCYEDIVIHNVYQLPQRQRFERRSDVCSISNAMRAMQDAGAYRTSPIVDLRVPGVYPESRRRQDVQTSDPI